jgi:peptidoglycan/LPS O-acetylase OafA/YrhL
MTRPIEASRNPAVSVVMTVRDGAAPVMHDATPLSTGATADASGRVSALDGVRGVAILLVLVYHLALYGAPPATSAGGRLLHAIAGVGWVGVDLFFVLSGFLITGILHDAKAGEHYFRNFYVRRALRIFPLYFGVLAVVCGVLPRLIPQHDGLRSLVAQSAWYWSYATNVLIAREGWPAFVALAHFWSLAVEEQFYLVWPVIVLLLGHRTLIVLCVALLVAAPLVRMGLLWTTGRDAAAFVLMPARMDALGAGALVALVARTPGGLEPLVRPARVVGGACAGALVIIALARHGLGVEDTLVQVVGYSLLALLFASFLVLALTAARGSPTAVFRLRGLRALGRYSYAIYVFHHPLLIFVPPTVLVGLVAGWPHATLWAHALYMLAVVALTLGLARLSWQLLEQPMLRWKDRFPYGARRVARDHGA